MFPLDFVCSGIVVLWKKINDREVIGYSFFYVAQNNIKVKDTAISFVSVKYPKKLISYLKKEKIYEIVSSEDSGIYYILPISKDDKQIPKMQLVVSSELSADDVLWLEMLRDDLSLRNLEECVNLYEKSEKEKYNLLDFGGRCLTIKGR